MMQDSKATKAIRKFDKNIIDLVCYLQMAADSSDLESKTANLYLLRERAAEIMKELNKLD